VDCILGGDLMAVCDAVCSMECKGLYGATLFNDVLYQDGIITRSDYHKMILKIKSRAKDLDKQNDFFARKNKQ
jgi:hypothetical protein